MKILVLNGSPRKNGGTAAMVKAFCNGARDAGHKPKRCRKMALLLCSGAYGVYDQAEGIYRTYLVDWFGAEDCGIFEATTSEAKSLSMSKRLRSFATSL